MARRSSGTPSILIALILFAVIFAWTRLRGPGPGPSREREHRRAHRLEQPYGIPESRRYSSGREQERHTPESCDTLGTSCQSQYFHRWSAPNDGDCRTRIRNGYPVPDPRCTPGGVNPSVTEGVLTDFAWRTECVRNCQTSEAEKHITYGWYGIHKPKRNSGDSQVCELDHLVPLELGGADGLGNIWPECGPDTATLHDRYFKVKDRVENYLSDEVRAGRMPLAAAQQGIATDWTKYLTAANVYCERGGRC